MNLKKRIGNAGFWVSIASFTLMALQNFGIHISVDKYMNITNIILTILVFLGILNDPTTKNTGYLDDKKKLP